MVENSTSPTMEPPNNLNRRPSEAVSILMKGVRTKRYTMAVLGFIGIANAYAMRSVLSLAITEMVVDIHKTTLDPNGCPGPAVLKNMTNPNAEFDWSEKLQGHILGSFYYGYVLAQIPAGILAQKYGGKHVFGVGMFLTSVLTLLTPMAARAGPVYLIIVRVLEGLGEGPTIPAMNTLLAQWVPINERSTIGSFVFAGNMIGTIVAQSTAGYMLKVTDDNWPLVFYTFGSIALIWYVFWNFFVYSRPSEHPSITDYELTYLERHLKGVSRNKEKVQPTPWGAMLLSGPMWGLMIGQIAHDWALFMIHTDLPKYMKSVMKFSIAETGVWSSMPHLIMWLTAILSGWLSDYLITNNKIGILKQRRLFSTIACVGPMLGTLAASYAGCDKLRVVMLFTVGMATMGFFYSSMKVNVLDLSPNYAGPAMALVNGVGAVAGIISPPLIGYLIPNNTLLEWRNVFWISGGVVLVANSVYVIFASAQIQWWNDPLPMSDTDDDL
ncbi:putative inorganic phosphate cotransporter isoform X1 [Adelges cooleyi]|uniref:putative inorganic phosphate cotransporter isoform X1 n=2 Tax=Adelges cooleyi TaxID=133065 RepID=UPI00217F58D8|nr:putative inorganic phosphate cotransporter isoform X1 [Adelges cooleyi]